MRREKPEQIELLRRQHDLLRAPREPAGAAVEKQLADADRPWAEGRRVRSPQHRAHARGELARRKRLRDVVVGSELEPDDPIGLLDARGEEDHRQLGPAPNPPAELEPVGPREHDVEDDEARGAGLDQLARVVSVRRLERGESIAPEIPHDDVANDWLVVDDEDRAHGPIVASTSGDGRSPIPRSPCRR
jgi:hypothetical protein